ncbi:hypothetical protein V8C44DRAFT_167386 [Trichoderma aethiopicum]
MSRYTHSLLCYTTPGRHNTCRPPIPEPYSPPRASRTHGSQYDVSVTHPSRTAQDNGKTVIRQRILQYQRRVNITIDHPYVGSPILRPPICHPLGRHCQADCYGCTISYDCVCMCALAASFLPRGLLGGSCWLRVFGRCSQSADPRQGELINIDGDSSCSILATTPVFP